MTYDDSFVPGVNSPVLESLHFLKAGDKLLIQRKLYGTLEQMYFTTTMDGHYYMQGASSPYMDPARTDLRDYINGQFDHIDPSKYGHWSKPNDTIYFDEWTVRVTPAVAKRIYQAGRETREMARITKLRQENAEAEAEIARLNKLIFANNGRIINISIAIDQERLGF